MYPLYEFGGSGPIIHVAVANGFPPATYAPVVQPFTDQYRVVSLLPRALWPGEQPPNELRQWDMLADDLLAGMEAHGLEDVIAIGHSFGATASMIAAVRQPRRFRALCLLDPMLFRPEWAEGFEQMQRDGTIREFPLAQGALRRRSQFEDAQTAFDYFRGKKLFGDWPDSALWLYVNAGTRPAAGGGLELVWPPEWEAYYFMTAFTRSWEVAPKLRGQLPVLAVRGVESDGFVAEIGAMLHDILPDMEYVEIEGYGHLFPQAAPEKTHAVIADWLQRI
ncbi:MAG: alpha/beta hydrolase [Anaerolineae bacterium]